MHTQSKERELTLQMSTLSARPIPHLSRVYTHRLARNSYVAAGDALAVYVHANVAKVAVAAYGDGQARTVGGPVTASILTTTPGQLVARVQFKQSDVCEFMLRTFEAITSSIAKYYPAEMVDVERMTMHAWCVEDQARMVRETARETCVGGFSMRAEERQKFVRCVSGHVSRNVFCVFRNVPCCV
jgi:hypothetical protein